VIDPSLVRSPHLGPNPPFSDCLVQNLENNVLTLVRLYLPSVYVGVCTSLIHLLSIVLLSSTKLENVILKYLIKFCSIQTTEEIENATFIQDVVSRFREFTG